MSNMSNMYIYQIFPKYDKHKAQQEEGMVLISSYQCAIITYQHQLTSLKPDIQFLLLLANAQIVVIRLPLVNDTSSCYSGQRRCIKNINSQC